MLYLFFICFVPGGAPRCLNIRVIVPGSVGVILAIDRANGDLGSRSRERDLEVRPRASSRDASLSSGTDLATILHDILAFRKTQRASASLPADDVRSVPVAAVPVAGPTLVDDALIAVPEDSQADEHPVLENRGGVPAGQPLPATVSFAEFSPLPLELDDILIDVPEDSQVDEHPILEKRGGVPAGQPLSPSPGFSPLPLELDDSEKENMSSLANELFGPPAAAFETSWDPLILTSTCSEIYSGLKEDTRAALLFSFRESSCS
ncbi:uncharacterized protein LOC105187608 [Harpegnathos saltator]|uniref:uncharacterized protein LOC105187608 n=1 Tax=Harpegnathos saltator TaxID=610380 RepID=UPI000DBEE193|nr:uncharacterized protein LOC105187608 [Harpegnathos saltator]